MTNIFILSFMLLCCFCLQSYSCKFHYSVTEDTVIPSSAPCREAQGRGQEARQLLRHLFIHDFVVQIWTLQMESRKKGRVNIIGCLFHRVLLLALPLCPTQELVQRTRTQILICQNGREEGCLEEALLGMFTLDLTGNTESYF